MKPIGLLFLSIMSCHINLLADVGPLFDPQPSVSYYASLDTMPEDQGWRAPDSYNNAPVPYVNNGLLYVGPTEYEYGLYWSYADHENDFLGAEGFYMEARIKIVESSYIPGFGEEGPPWSDGTNWRCGYSLAAADKEGRQFSIELSIDGFRLTANKAKWGDGSTDFVFWPMDQFNTFQLVVEDGIGSLFVNRQLAVSLPVGETGVYETPNLTYFGDGTRFGWSQTELDYFEYGAVPEPATFILIGLALMPVIRRRRHVSR